MLMLMLRQFKTIYVFMLMQRRLLQPRQQPQPQQTAMCTTMLVREVRALRRPLNPGCASLGDGANLGLVLLIASAALVPEVMTHSLCHIEAVV